MKFIKHNIEKNLVDDLKKKMVFLVGPRQIGKTTLAKKIIRQLKGKYLLYDDIDDRENILKRTFLGEQVVCLDEFHKYARWKSYIKGLFDKHRERLQILLTGSAKLDVHQKSGDSLFGRYYLHYLHPLTLAELHSTKIKVPGSLDRAHKPLNGLDELLHFGGFPEPFLTGTEKEHGRWSRQRRELLIHEDMRELTRVHLISVAENLLLMLTSRIGSLFSATSLSEDLQVSVPSILNWISIFERLYIVFKLLPYHKRVNRSIRKTPKLYFWDWSQPDSSAVRFENCIAGHLFKAVSYWNAIGLTKCAQLHFIRDRQGREVDFLVTDDNEPWFLVETKLSEEKIGHSLNYFTRKFHIPGIQLVLSQGVYKKSGLITVISADTWLGHLV